MRLLNVYLCILPTNKSREKCLFGSIVSLRELLTCPKQKMDVVISIRHVNLAFPSTWNPFIESWSSVFHCVCSSIRLSPAATPQHFLLRKSCRYTVILQKYILHYIDILGRTVEMIIYLMYLHTCIHVFFLSFGKITINHSQLQQHVKVVQLWLSSFIIMLLIHSIGIFMYFIQQ